MAGSVADEEATMWAEEQVQPVDESMYLKGFHPSYHLATHNAIYNTHKL